jgi:ferredoxin
MVDSSQNRVSTIEEDNFLSISSSSILDSALSSGLILKHSCKKGNCGAYETTLLEGEVKEIQAQTALNECNKIDIYACGSREMIQSAKLVFTHAGLNENNFYTDAFVQSY